MALYNYLASKSESSNHVRKSINVVDLMNRVKLEEKNEKKHNLIVAAAALSVLAISGLIISL